MDLSFVNPNSGETPTIAEYHEVLARFIKGVESAEDESPETTQRKTCQEARVLRELCYQQMILAHARAQGIVHPAFVPRQEEEARRMLQFMEFWNLCDGVEVNDSEDMDILSGPDEDDE